MRFEELNCIHINRTELPQYFIYFLVDNEEVVYVGQTKNGITRPFEHCKNKKFDAVYLLPVAEKDLDQLEGIYILKYAPKYNGKINNTHCYPYSKIKTILRSYPQYKNITHNEINKYVCELNLKGFMDPYNHLFKLHEYEFVQLLSYLLPEEADNRGWLNNVEGE